MPMVARALARVQELGRSSPAAGYAAAALMTALALGLTLVLQPVMRPLVTPFFFMAVLLATWYGGLGPGLFATLLSTLCIEYFLIIPRGILAAGPGIVPRLAVFAAAAVLVNWLNARQQQANQALRGLIETIPAGVLVAGPAGEIILSNPSARETLGGAVTGDAYGPAGGYTLYRPDGTPFPPEELPLSRALGHGETTCGVEIHVRRADSTAVVLSACASPVRNRRGQIGSAVAVFQNITDRKRDEEERARLYEAEREARAEAQDANQAKDQFVALVSHELRGPLAAITAGLHLLRRVVPQEGRVGHTFEIVERNVSLQTRLVNDLLDLSRLTRGKLQLQRAPVELKRVVDAAAQTYAAEAKAAGLTLTCDADPGLWVQGDLDRLQQVVMNLLSNAVKFTPRGGSIHIACYVHNTQQAHIVVEDTGTGIDQEMLGRLFTMFEQGEVAGERRPGLGIGLALVKGITERHGGRVWAESEGIGKGSRFTVELPLVAGPVAAPSPPPSVSRGHVDVLLVEDNPDTRTLVADSLTVAGYEVQTAESGEAALEVIEERRPAIILADIGLPGMDGYELLRRARELPGMEEVPAFAVTGFGSEEDVRRSREAGFAGHFVKPVNVGVLDQRMREWLGRPSEE